LLQYKINRRHAWKVDVVSCPFLPRYLFGTLDISTDRWWTVQSTVGVLHLVCHGEEPTSLLNGMFDALRAREDAYGYYVINLTDGFKKKKD